MGTQCSSVECSKESHNVAWPVTVMCISLSVHWPHSGVSQTVVTSEVVFSVLNELLSELCFPNTHLADRTTDICGTRFCPTERVQTELVSSMFHTAAHLGHNVCPVRTSTPAHGTLCTHLSD